MLSQCITIGYVATINSWTIETIEIEID